MTTRGVGGSGVPPIDPSKGPHREEKKNPLDDAITSFFKLIGSNSETQRNLSSSQNTGFVGRIKSLFKTVPELSDQTDGLSNMIDHMEAMKTADLEKMSSEQRNVFLHVSADRIKHQATVSSLL